MKFLLLIILVISFIFSNDDTFIGYRKWQNSQSFVAIKNFNASEYTSDIVLFCKDSSHVKISEDKNFKNTEWLDYRARYDWIFKRKEGRRFITIFAVFRRKNPVTSVYEISPVANAVIDLQDIQSKLEFTDSGIINWSKGELTIHAKVSAETNLLIGQLEKLQREAEVNINEIAFHKISKIYYSYPYRIQSFLKNNDKGLFSYLKAIELKEINYFSNYIQLDYFLPFFKNSYENLFSLYRKKYQAITPTTELKFLKNQKKYSRDSFSNVIVDVRDYFNFKISLVPKIIDQQQNVLFSPLFYIPNESHENKDLTDNITNETNSKIDNKMTDENLEKKQDDNLRKKLFQIKEEKINFSSFKYLRKTKILQNAVYMKALEVDAYSRIIISDRYKKYFLNAKNKNLIVLVN